MIDANGLRIALNAGETTIMAVGKGDVVGTAIISAQAEPTGSDRMRVVGADSSAWRNPEEEITTNIFPGNL